MVKRLGGDCDSPKLIHYYQLRSSGTHVLFCLSENIFCLFTLYFMFVQLCFRGEHAVAST